MEHPVVKEKIRPLAVQCHDAAAPHVRRAYEQVAPHVKTAHTRATAAGEWIVEDLFVKNVRKAPGRIAAALEPRIGRDAAHYIAVIDIDSPVTLTFAFLCWLVHVLSVSVFPDWQFRWFCCLPWGPFNFWSPFSYWSLFAHVLGHGDWGHLSGNLCNFLLVGPACEREFGSFSFLKVILHVALWSAAAHMAFGHPAALQLGASGVVFMTILLNSLLQVRLGKLPLTFIVSVILWVQREVLNQLFADKAQSGVSNVAHLAGALVGTYFGFKLHGDKVRERLAEIGRKWLQKTTKEQ